MYLNKIHHHHHQNHTAVVSSPSGNSNIGPAIHAYNNAFGSDFATLDFVVSKSLSQFSTQSDKSVEQLKLENGGVEWDSYKVSVVPLGFIETNFHVSVIDFLKLDCEGCEFDLIVNLKDFFINKTRLRYLGAEIHLSLMDKNEVTIAKKPSQITSDSALSILRQRGCGKINWQINC